LLNWTRTQMQGIKPNPSEIELSALAEENVSLVKLSAYKKGIALENEITEPVKAYADSEMIKLVFRNLISNAIKFTAIGDKVTLSATSDGEYVTIAVKDTGHGIAEENQQKLFQAGDYTTFGTANEKGTGLGLALCKDFIESNHGKLWVESKEKEGSTFSFTLPVHAAVLHSSPFKKAALS
jgi:two-component system, sensor histidine kinase and response regulator